MEETRKGMLLVVSGASGTGKGTLVKRLLDEDGTFAFSVSVVTPSRVSNRDTVRSLAAPVSSDSRPPASR